ncbi:uncharacterized protein BX663DRAFT_516640 [Cokeromyces recurvatus]|uniref:uncharacterized protein n=1 Tax=Cokeromyces recurvatus TaxID=90255 RepID=UPI00221F3B56|nr:uncharacterized protein BX663DRAFT_516640 [Cokeromyces recurvatus]KAI7900823.1 hypothetical protein BX663DRAFT_516640 [Cokeromyces recurvatus]
MISTITSTTLTFKSSPEPLLSYMTSNIDHLIECSKERIYYQHMLLPELPIFIKIIYRKCHITPTVLVIGLMYLERLKKNLPDQAQGGIIINYMNTYKYIHIFIYICPYYLTLMYKIEYDTPYKLFLAAMIVATKYVEDDASYTLSIYRIVLPLYTYQQLNEMERSFLDVLKVKYTYTHIYIYIHTL